MANDPSLLMLISPTKTLDFSGVRPKQASRPKFVAQTAELVSHLQKLKKPELKKLLGVSSNLADLNHERFQVFDSDLKDLSTSTAQSAAFAFRGPAFVGMDPVSFTDSDMMFCQSSLQILCGLYGALRPLDAIQPYRLCMGEALPNSKGKNLYKFWTDTLTAHLLELISKHSMTAVVNIASDEYYKAIDAKAVAKVVPIYKMHFRTAGRALATFSKYARGLMCRYICMQKITEVKHLKNFNLDGYSFSKAQSDEANFVFTRQAAPPKPKKVKKAKAQPKPKKEPKAKEEEVAETERGVDPGEADEKVIKARKKTKPKRDKSTAKTKTDTKSIPRSTRSSPRLATAQAAKKQKVAS